MHKQTLVPIVENKNAIAGRFSMRKHKVGDIKWHRDAVGRVVCDIDSLKVAMGMPGYQHPVVHNKVVSGTGGYGRNLLLRAMSNDVTYPIVITAGKIGTGTNTPVDGDTDLQTAVLSGIDIQLFELSNDTLVVSLFIPSADIADGTYTEFGLFMGAQLFCRALISPTFAKSANEDTTIEYTLTFSAA